MTGVTITSGFDAGPFKEAMARAMQVAARPEPLLKRIGVGMVDVTQQHFRDEKDPAGNPWKPLSPGYAEFKRGPGILRESAMRGGLMGSMTFQLAGGSSVSWGSGKIYADVHQVGRVIVPVRAKSLVFQIGNRFVHAMRVVIPARPFVGFGEHERRMVGDVVAFTLEEAIGA